jgi:hypothetical protein
MDDPSVLRHVVDGLDDIDKACDRGDHGLHDLLVVSGACVDIRAQLGKCSQPLLGDFEVAGELRAGIDL